MIYRQPVLIFVCILFSGSIVYAQFFNKQLNTYNDQGLKSGTWKLYWDEEKTTPMSVINYDDGRETGVCKEYHCNGQLRLKFRHQKNKTRVKYFSPERKLEQKGWAVFEYRTDDIRYYWDGKWKFYNTNRKKVNVSCYKNGEIINEIDLGN